jgi:hypothetical protein|tara:strand:- start:275 stop:412 length:138 start_codon:yes stop_codon:yes gene_type:complete
MTGQDFLSAIPANIITLALPTLSCWWSKDAVVPKVQNKPVLNSIK